jgi:hypothetical protein
MRANIGKHANHSVAMVSRKSASNHPKARSLGPKNKLMRALGLPACSPP